MGQIRPTSHFVNNEKIIYSNYEIFVGLEYNISRNNHVTWDVRPGEGRGACPLANFWHICHFALWEVVSQTKPCWSPKIKHFPPKFSVGYATVSGPQKCLESPAVNQWFSNGGMQRRSKGCTNFFVMKFWRKSKLIIGTFLNILLMITVKGYLKDKILAKGSTSLQNVEITSKAESQCSK